MAKSNRTRRQAADSALAQQGEAEKVHLIWKWNNDLGMGFAIIRPMSSLDLVSRSLPELAPAQQLFPYHPPWWLPGGHLQTLYSALCTPLPKVVYRRERWDTPDGDVVVVDHVDGPATAPLIVLFHGLEGGAQSHYARALMQHVERIGWRGMVPHFRGCGGEPNNLPRAYHSGDSAEIAWLLAKARASIGSAPIFAMGVSLGGNALLKWCGEQSEAATSAVSAIIAVSVPYDLHATGDHLAQGFNRVYTWNFLRTLKANSRLKLARFPNIFDAKKMQSASNMREFDDAVTAPLHGFADVDDYWTRASSKPWLKHIRVPTYLIHARNDPFTPETSLPGERDISAAVQLHFQSGGGHAGFVAAPFPGQLNWLVTTTETLFRRHMA